MDDMHEGDVSFGEETDELQDASNWGNSAKDEVMDSTRPIKNEIDDLKERAKDKIEDKIKDKIEDKIKEKRNNSNNSSNQNSNRNTNPNSNTPRNTNSSVANPSSRTSASSPNSNLSSNTGNAAKSGAETAGNAAKNGAETASNIAKSGAETAGKTAKTGADTAAAAGKTTAGAAQATSTAATTATSAAAATAEATAGAATTTASALTSVIAAAAPVIGVIIGIILALALIIVVILLIIAAVTSLNQNQTNTPVTTECSQILEYFDRFQKYGLEYSQYGYNYDRIQYRRKYTAIKNAGYSMELAGVYKLIAYNNVFKYQALTNYQSANGTDDDKNLKTVKLNYLSFYDNPDSFQAGICEPCFTSSISGNTVDWVKFKTNFEEASDQGKYKYHYYFTDDLFKICLDSFTTTNNNDIIPSVSQIQKNLAEQKNIKEGSKEYEALEDEARETAYKQIYNRMCFQINNAGQRVQIGLFGDSDGNTYGKYWYVGDCIIGQTRKESNGTTSIAKLSVDGNDYNSTFYNDMVSSIYSMNAANSSAYSVANLALSQVGNNYKTYCDELNNGQGTEWCAIFAGWCLKKSGMDLNSLGYSASVPVWKKNATAKGMYKANNGGYTPKVGDLVIYDYDPSNGNDVDHIEVVVEVSGNTVVTVGGNTGSGGYTNTKVNKFTFNYKDSSSSIVGFINIPYANTSGMCAASKDFQTKFGYINQSNYTPVAYKLTSEQKAFVEKVVEGEYGGDSDGCLLIAQCIRDALVDGRCTDPMKIRKSVSEGGLGYDGYKDNASQMAKDAVTKIFDQGMYAVKYKIRYMCTESYFKGNPDDFRHNLPLVLKYNGITGTVYFFGD